MTWVNRSSTRNATIALVNAIWLSALAVVGRAEEASQTKKIAFDDLKFAIKKNEAFKREMLGEKIEALNGKRVQIRGWMLPTFESKNVKQFVLANDIFQMGFGPGQPLDEVIAIDQKPGVTTNYSSRPITVDGIFSIREFKVDGKTYSVYHVEATSVKVPVKEVK